MADSKISALPASTTPLAGTEVLPIVQSSATKQVSVANLTAGRSVSVADLAVSTGNIVPATAAKGINFTANTPAAGMTSQLLNWYEEGTWTPSAGPGLTVVGSFTSSGTYTKVGRVVNIVGIIKGSTSIAVASLTLMCRGLPFAVGGSGGVGVSVNANGSTTTASFASGTDLYSAGAISATSEINFSITYFA